MKTLTLTLNDKTYDELSRNVNSGQVSSFVDELIQAYFTQKSSKPESNKNEQKEDYGSLYELIHQLPKASSTYSKDPIEIQRVMRAEWGN